MDDAAQETRGYSTKKTPHRSAGFVAHVDLLRGHGSNDLGQPDAHVGKRKAAARVALLQLPSNAAHIASAGADGRWGRGVAAIRRALVDEPKAVPLEQLHAVGLLSREIIHGDPPASILIWRGGLLVREELVKAAPS